MGTGKMSASEWVQELLERIAAGVGVDARLELQADAERRTVGPTNQPAGLP
jgi:hypothetical protein